MRVRDILALACTFFLPALLLGQITNGQKPKLPAPFSTKSAGNEPEKLTPPAGFLPTVPQGFRVSLFATNVKRPRSLTVAANGDIALADMGAGDIEVICDPQNTGAA